MKRPTKEEVEREIAALDGVEAPALRLRWRELYRRDPPPRIRAGLLRRGIAYQLQVLAFGGLKPQTIRLLRKLAAEFRASRQVIADGNVEPATVPARAASVRRTLSPGTQLYREWNGTTEIVEVSADGFVWRGKRYRTLSAVAVAITGTKWSGPKFFGLTKTSDDIGLAPRSRRRPPWEASDAEVTAP